MKTTKSDAKRLVSQLVVSASRGNTKRCRELIAMGANVNGVACLERTSSRTALLVAVEKKRIPCALALLKLGGDPNWSVPYHDPYEPGETALSLAAREGALKLIVPLVLAGARIDHERRGGGAALACAASQGHLKVVKCLLARGATPVNYVLDGAVRKGDAKVVDILLRAGADPNRPHLVRDALLGLAATNGHLSVIKLLLKHGARIDDSPNGLTPLVLAIIARRTNVALYLIRAGARIEARDNGGRTALLFAAKTGDARVLRELIARGADLTVKDPKGATAYDLATQSRNLQTLRLLRSNVAPQL